jgi:hypothetical protein
MTSDKQPDGVTIGNVQGGIHGSIIAGRDVRDATITLGGQPTPADKQPTVDELRQLLAEIQRELAELAAQKDALKKISPATPFTAQGAEQSVRDAVEKIEPDIKPDEAQSVRKSLTEATSLLEMILEGAQTVAEKTGEVGKALQPVIERLGPLVERVGVAALWVARLWLQV